MFQCPKCKKPTDLEFELFKLECKNAEDIAKATMLLQNSELDCSQCRFSVADSEDDERDDKVCEEILQEMHERADFADQLLEEAASLSTPCLSDKVELLQLLQNSCRNKKFLLL